MSETKPNKKRVVVICPGRGSYTKETLGYIKRLRSTIANEERRDTFEKFLIDIDERREQMGDPRITELDLAAAFRPNIHTKGEHASALIYACAFGDFLAINRDRYDIRSEEHTSE